MNSRMSSLQIAVFILCAFAASVRAANTFSAALNGATSRYVAKTMQYVCKDFRTCVCRPACQPATSALASHLQVFVCDQRCGSRLDCLN